VFVDSQVSKLISGLAFLHEGYAVVRF